MSQRNNVATNIYEVITLENYCDGTPSYAVSHVYEGIVSVWDNIDFAYQVCEDLELGI